MDTRHDDQAGWLYWEGPTVNLRMRGGQRREVRPGDRLLAVTDERGVVVEVLQHEQRVLH